jgi:hypothetical protein
MIANIDLQPIITYTQELLFLILHKKTKTLSLVRFLTILNKLTNHKKIKAIFCYQAYIIFS